MMRRILIVEDDPDILLSAQLTLQFADYETLTASSAEDALDLMDRERPVDVVLLDLRLPGIDGFGFLERLQGSPGWRDAQIIIISAHATPSTQHHALTRGCSAYLTKPFSGTTLISTIEAVLTT